MSPKEKAKSLFYMFTEMDSTIVECGRYCQGGTINTRSLGVEAALICVEEIQNIKSVEKDIDLYDYWEEVKLELKKL